MSQDSSHLVASFRDFLKKGQKAFESGSPKDAISHLNIAKNMLSDIVAKGIHVDEAEVASLESLIQEATRAAETKGKTRMLKQFQNLKQGASEFDGKHKIMSIFLFGLDNAGKTTLVEYIINEEFIDPTPTVGVNITRITLGSIKFVFNDVGGQEAYRANWMNYWKNPDFMIFMVDANDGERFDQAREGLWTVLDDPATSGVPLLILSNKMDLPGARLLDEVLGSLNAGAIRDRMVGSFAISVKEGSNLEKALNFLASDALNDEEFRAFIGKEVDRLNRNFGELYKIFIAEAEMHEREKRFEKALQRVYKAKKIQEELFKQGISKAQKEITRCNVWSTRLEKVVSAKQE